MQGVYQPQQPVPHVLPGGPGGTAAAQAARDRGMTTAVMPPAASNAVAVQAPMYLISTGKRPPILPWPDISDKARWSVSSYKFGFGAECLRDGDPDTFWQ